MLKKVTFKEDAREELKIGMDTVADAVKVTMGAKGRNVVIDQGAIPPHITKDGFNVSKTIFLKDPIQNMGAQMMKEVAAKTVDKAGDATTQSVVLAQALIHAGLRNLASGASPIDLKRGIDKAVLEIVKDLKAQSKAVGTDIEKIRQVATVSANNDPSIGNLIAEAKDKVGKDGVVSVEESNTINTTLEVVEGLEIEKGYITPHFINNGEKQSVEMDEPYILIYDKKIHSMKQLLPILEQTVPTNKGLLVIAEDVEGEALSTLIVNKLQGKLNIAAIKAEGFGDRRKAILQDLAVVTGGTVISEDSGRILEDVMIGDLGTCEKIKITKDSTAIINGNGSKEDIEGRVKELKTQLKADDLPKFYKESTEKRIAKLSGGVAILYVGAATEVEIKEKIDRVDDALAATTAAIEEGIVTGGGVALIRAIKSLENLKGINEDETTGIAIVRKAIEAPIRQIVKNAGGDDSVMVNKVKEGKKDFGFNAMTGEYENLFKIGIIDPTKVTRVALENASSIAGMFLTTECVISTDIIEKK